MIKVRFFPVAQLLSCLHELKMENVRLEETLSQLARRRDHLLALNTRLSLSLASGSSLGLGTRYVSHYSTFLSFYLPTDMKNRLLIIP